MPCEFLIDVEHRLVISRGTGTFRYVDFAGHMRMLGPDPRFRPEFDHLVDCRKFERFDVTAAQVESMGEQSLFAAQSRRAFVVASELHYGLGRMFATYREMKRGQTTMVFRDMREAIAWLGLPESYNPDSLGSPSKIVIKD